MELEIGVGEFIDRQSILMIKKSKGLSVENELRKMEEKNSLFSNLGFFHYLNLMVAINTALWDLEGTKRSGISRADQIYIEVSELITQLNDLRFITKRQIDVYFESEITEKKSHRL